MKIKFTKLFEVYLGIIAFGFVVFPKLITLLIVGLGVIVISGYLNKKVTFQLNKIGVLLMLFYVAYIVGVFFTHNSEQASVYIVNKLSFLIFPLLFSLKSDDKWDLRNGYLGFIIGVFVVVLLGFKNSYTCYTKPEGTFSCFLASIISPLHHPTYLTSYFVLSICFALHGWKTKMKSFSPYWVIPLVLFLIVLHGLLLSLSGILFLFILIAISIGLWLKRKFGNIVFYISILVLPLICFKTMISIPQVEGEWGNAKWYADEYFKNPDDFVSKREYPMSGTEVRIVMWTAAINGIIHHPFGVGTGNVDEYLAKELTVLKQEKLIEHQYNPHNQFLQTTLEIGVFGLLILLLFITFTVQFAFKHKNWIILVLVANLVFNSLFESMLQRQSGIVFYSFWICLLVFYSLNANKEKDNEIILN
jgi:O-antigen ligase